MIKIGPVGDLSLVASLETGENWDEKGHTKLTQIFISYGSSVNSIQFQYEENGALVLSDLHGKILGTDFIVVKLRFPEEYLSGMRVCYDNSSVKSLTFITNLSNHGPFGLKETNPQGAPSSPGSKQYGNTAAPTAKDQKLSEFLIELGKDRQFGGFHGTADAHGLRSIGVYLQPCTILANLPVDTL